MTTASDTMSTSTSTTEEEQSCACRDRTTQSRKIFTPQLLRHGVVRATVLAATNLLGGPLTAYDRHVRQSLDADGGKSTGSLAAV